MLVHFSNEIIQHLFKNVERMKIFDNVVQIFKINECESYALSKTREIASRKFDNVKSIDIFFSNQLRFDTNDSLIISEEMDFAFRLLCDQFLFCLYASSQIKR